MADDKLKVPKRTGGDAAHAVVKAGLSAVPVVGGTAVELFQYIVQPPLEKRREEWMADVGEKLHELESSGLKLEDLQNNQEFVSAVMHASQVALRTHQDAKLEALRNAVLNVATGQGPDQTLQHLFLEFVDSFTELHLRILKLFRAPPAPPGMSMGGLGSVLEHNISDLRGQQEFYKQLWRDFYSRGLVNTDSVSGTMSASGLASKRTTGLGDAFLSFIESPK